MDETPRLAKQISLIVQGLTRIPFVLGHLLPQFFNSSVVVIPDISVGLAKLFRYFGERKPFKEMHPQRFPLVVR
jgi:hypothetical protein